MNQREGSQMVRVRKVMDEEIDSVEVDERLQRSPLGKESREEVQREQRGGAESQASAFLLQREETPYQTSDRSIEGKELYILSIIISSNRAGRCSSSPRLVN